LETRRQCVTPCFYTSERDRLSDILASRREPAPGIDLHRALFAIESSLMNIDKSEAAPALADQWLRRL
jgi:hypothetical protein